MHLLSTRSGATDARRIMPHRAVLSSADDAWVREYTMHMHTEHLLRHSAQGLASRVAVCMSCAAPRRSRAHAARIIYTSPAVLRRASSHSSHSSEHTAFIFIFGAYGTCPQRSRPAPAQRTGAAVRWLLSVSYITAVFLILHTANRCGDLRDACGAVRPDACKQY